MSSQEDRNQSDRENPINRQGGTYNSQTRRSDLVDDANATAGVPGLFRSWDSALNAAVLQYGLGNQLHLPSNLQGHGIQPDGTGNVRPAPTWDALQQHLLRQRLGLMTAATGLAADSIGGTGRLPYFLGHQQQQVVGSQGFATNLTMGENLRDTQASLREAQLRLLLAQYNQQQQQLLLQNLPATGSGLGLSSQSLHQPLSNLIHPQAQSFLSRSANLGRTTAGLPTPEQILNFEGIRDMGGLGVTPLTSLSQNVNNDQSLSQLLRGLPSGNPDLTAALHLQQQQIQGAPLRQVMTATVVAVGSPSVARLPPAQSPVADEDQPEMKDAEYFELFGFNDEDAIQTINETFPHKLYRMLFEVERDGQEDIVSFFPHGKAFIVHNPKRFVGAW